MFSNFTKEMQGDIVVEKVELSRATFQEVQEFKNILNEDIKNGFLKFVVDLSGCEFMDSTFLSTLVTTLKSLISHGGSLKLSSVSSEVRSLMELTGIHRVFEIFETKDEGIKSFRHGV
jgi:anti-anti-sigma factor